MSGYTNRIVGHAEVDPATLVANPANWRRHPDRQMAALRGSLAAVGWISSIIVNKTTGNLVDGHARVEQAIKSHEHLVPVTYIEISEADEKLALAILDPMSAMAQTDEQALATLLSQIDAGTDGLGELLGALAQEAGMIETPDVSDAIAKYCPACHQKLTSKRSQIAIAELESGDGEDAG